MIKIRPVCSMKLSAAFAILALVSGAAALPANAEKKARAPISYAGDTARPAAAARPASTAETSRRIEFRYPDQPDRLYSRDGVRPASAAEPVKFSSSASAIDQLKARSYSTASAPAAPPVSAQGDPNLTRGAFDARAAAQAQSAPVIAKPSVELPMPPLRAETPVARPLLQADTVKVVEPVTPVYDETVFAVVYEAEFEGLPTANGELYTNTGMTAAHPDLPLPSLLHVVNEATGREIVVRVNDRGPFEDGAGLQLSARAADALGMSGAGRGKVSLRYLGPAPQLDKAAMPAPRSQPATSPLFEAPPVQKIAYEPRLPVADPEGYTGETRYAVQLAAFSDRANADVFYREVMGIIPATIEAAEVNGVTWHRVRVGPVDGRAAADDLRARLMAEGFDQARIVPAS